MKATVNISLKELDDLRWELEMAKKRISELESQKEIKIMFDADIYSWQEEERNRKFDSRAMVYGNYSLLKKADNWADMKEVIDSCFAKVLEDSIPVKFYRKFPKWVHKLMLK